MKIKSIHTKNFRTLEDVTLNFDTYFTSISGKNNAGKTSVIKAIRSFFRGREQDFPVFEEENDISYSTSKTQWVNSDCDIVLTYTLEATRSEDPGLYSFISKIAEIEELQTSFDIQVIVRFSENNEKEITISIDGRDIGKYETGEIFQRIAKSDIVFLHNSTGGENRLFFPSGIRSFHDMILPD